MDTKAQTVPVQPMAPHPNDIAAHKETWKKEGSQKILRKILQNMEVTIHCFCLYDSSI